MKSGGKSGQRARRRDPLRRPTKKNQQRRPADDSFLTDEVLHALAFVHFGDEQIASRIEREIVCTVELTRPVPAHPNVSTIFSVRRSSTYTPVGWCHRSRTRT